MSIDHDQIFKNLIETFFREFMLLFCPAGAKLIDFTKVEFLREEFFTDVKRGKRKRLDLVVRVGLKSGAAKFILVHVEFEASRKPEDFPRRMFNYFCQLFLRHQTEIVPIAVFSDDARWRKPVPNDYEIRLPTRPVVHFQYELIKLKDLDYRTYLKSNNPLAYALMAKMNYNRKQRVRLKADFLRLILGTGIDPARASVLREFVETYMVLDRDEDTQFKQIVRTERQYQKVEKMITTYEKEAMEKGRVEGQRKMLILQLEKKFGKLSPAVKKKIRQFDSPKKLESLLLAVLDATSLNDLEL